MNFRLLLLSTVFTLLVLIPSSVVHSSTYYVSMSGSDSNSGTKESPFRTIEHAAGILSAGDTCVIRGGTYRETIRPAGSGVADHPIIFRSYRNEIVTVSGAEVLSNWSKISGDLWECPLPWTMGSGADQLFVGGRMVSEARWPVSGLDPLRPRLAEAGAGTSATEIVDPALNFPPNYWVGATVWVLGGCHSWDPWVAETSTITSSDTGTITFSPLAENTIDYTPVAGDYYCIVGGPIGSILAPWQWRIIGGTLTVRLPPGSTPDQYLIEAKRRTLAFDLSGKSWIDIDHIHCFSNTIDISNCHHCELSSLDMTYLSHFTVCDKGWDTNDSTGVIISGDHNEIRDSVVSYSAGNGITVLGANNTVENCVVHGCDYSVTDSAAIRVTGSSQLISHNTVYECGRCAILNRELAAGRIVGNDISYFAMMSRDTGGTYCFQTDGKGTEIVGNVVHDAVDALYPGLKFTPGIYLDNGTSNMVVDHNLVYNVDEGIKMDTPCLNDIVTDNIFDNNSSGSSVAGSNDLTGSSLTGNIFTQAVEVGYGGTFSQNSSVYPVRGELCPQPLPQSQKSIEQAARSLSAGADFVPDQPKNVALSIGHGGQYLLSWERCRRAKTYTVYIRKSGFGEYNVAAQGVRQTSYSLSIPIGVGSCEVCVAASNDRTESPKSVSVTVAAAQQQ